MKYIVYARKSTEDREDRQVLSIDSQIEEIQTRFPLEFKDALIIKESKSAYKPYNRPEFQKMVELLADGKYQGVLVWHPDRLSREPISGGMVMHLLDQGFIKDLKFASYQFLHSPEGKMMLAMTLSQSKYSSEKLSVDVKRGMLKKCKMGQMPTKSPLGYMPDRMAEKGEKKHIPDPDRFDLVRKMWDLVLTGQYSILEIVRQANSWGLTTRPTKHSPAQPLSKATIYKTFTRIFYTGSFLWDGESYKGDHLPMINMEEFERVQQIIGSKYVPRTKINESLTSGLVKCPCGGSIVVDHRKKFVKAKNSYETYLYARCSRQKKGQLCKEPQVNVNELEEQIVSYLGKLKISDAFHKWAIKNLKVVKDHERKQRFAEINASRKAHDNCQRKLDNLLNLRISADNSDGSLISDEEFKIQRTLIIKERDRLSDNLRQTDINTDKWMDTLEEAFDLAVNAKERFENGDIKIKKLILSKVGANFILKDRKLQIEAKRPYLVFEERLPEIRRIEEAGGLEIKRFGQMKEATRDHLFQLWSG